MRFFLLFMVGFFSVINLSASKPTFSKGDKVLNLGVGFGSTFYAGYDYKTNIPLISTSFEFGVKRGVIEQGTIGVGGYVGYTTYEESHLTWGVNYSDIIIGARGTFHYPLVKNLDTYLGLVIGYNISADKPYGDYAYDDSYKTHGGLTYALVVGGRYYFTKKIAALAEIGLGLAYLNVGMSYKF